MRGTDKPEIKSKSEPVSFQRQSRKRHIDDIEDCENNKRLKTANPERLLELESLCEKMTATFDQVNKATSGISKIMLQQSEFAKTQNLLREINIDTAKPTERELHLVLDEQQRLQNRL